VCVLSGAVRWRLAALHGHDDGYHGCAAGSKISLKVPVESVFNGRFWKETPVFVTSSDILDTFLLFVLCNESLSRHVCCCRFGRW
jgi:hypothetical protein